LAITDNKTIFITSAAKAKHLEVIKSKDVLVWTRTKDPQYNAQLFTDLIGELQSKGTTVGHLAKDKYQGAFVTEWNQAFDESKFQMVDVGAGISSVMEVKDEEELRAVRLASKASVGLMTTYFVDQMTTYVDEEKKVKHSQFSKMVEDMIDDVKFFRQKELKLGSEFDPSQLDWCYSPIIQSGGKYDLRPSALSDDNRLEAGIIVCCIGLRYKSYCSNIGRTYMIDPTKQQEQNYNLLLSVQRHVLDMIKDGVQCKQVYQAAIDHIKEKSPEMEKYFIKNVGWGIGVEFRDSSLLLNAKNTRVLRDDMTLNLSVGFADIPNPEGKGANSHYSLEIIDTIRIAPDGPVVFTDSDKNRGNVSFYFKQDEDEVKKRKKETRGAASTAILKTKLRTETANHQEESGEKKRQLHQKELHEKLQKAGEQKYADEPGATGDETKAVFKKFESYKRDSQLPNAVKDLRVLVDNKSQSIILPISGRPVPFHISTYKNGSKNEEGDYVYIRLNFYSPGQSMGKKDEMPFEDPGAQFLKSVTLRSRDVERMNDVFKQIAELKKEAVKREAERKEMEDVVAQDKLVEIRNRRPLRLDSVYIRPGPEGKRVAGTLEVHQNGLRYQSPLGNDQRVNILFSNVAHMFFQPCDQELVVLIHLHLKNPIIVGKKKTKDVQFYREASDMAFDETGNRKRRYRYGDEDELEQEQEERRRRAALNKEFKNFSEQIAEASGRLLDVDIPFRELGFSGVPFRSNVLCQPTTECLVQLIDPPFLVVTLQDVEVVHLERVQFGLKQFDLVFVYKDYTKPVSHINSIPMTQLDSVKDWLNEMDIPYYEGPVNLNWISIMKTVVADSHEFFSGGGWSFLSTESGSESGEGSQSEDESEFEVSDDNPSDEDEEANDYSEEGSESYDEDGSEDESGEDWDDLDEQARREDNNNEATDKKRKR
jgi:nucleosome binding factor SPN SPT16 subunit